MTKVFVTSSVLVVWLFGCSRSTAAMTDSDLEKQIESRINSDTQLSGAQLSARANAALNLASISGTVESQALRSKALDLASSAHPGLVVLDNINVKPPELPRVEFTEDHAREQRQRARERDERIGNSVDDAWIHAAIVAKLLTDPNTAQQNINVDVNKAAVTLRGTVDTAEHKSEAERIVNQTDRVREINNLLSLSDAP